jgi:hypothetical protein
MSLTPSIGHSFVIVFERTAHAHRSTHRTAAVAAADPPELELPTRKPIDVADAMSRCRRQPDSSAVARAIAVSINR